MRDLKYQLSNGEITSSYDEARKDRHHKVILTDCFEPLTADEKKYRENRISKIYEKYNILKTS